MKTYSILTGLLLFSVGCFAQTITQRIDKAVKQLQTDPQMKHATMSLYVVETKTGKPVYALNEQVGLAPASTQKIFTSVAAFELLGKDFRYYTTFRYYKDRQDSISKYSIVIESNGDPTFGSDRYASTKPDVIFDSISNALKRRGVKKINDYFYILEGEFFDLNPIPDGWIWQDIGNYYGAYPYQLNWKENQYHLRLTSGDKIDQPILNLSLDPSDSMINYSFNNQVFSEKVGSGDQTYIYPPSNFNDYVITGSIPVSQSNFQIKGSVKNPEDFFIDEFRAYLKEKSFLDNNIPKHYNLKVSPYDVLNPTLYTHCSPTLDSINHWFLQKSINLYGESLLNTMGQKQKNFYSTQSGLIVLKDFWNKNGIEKSALNIVDGSGLSPQNRVTTDALVKALQYAKDKSWYNSFYNALPTYNGMRMKSGTIGGAKAYTGYHTSKSGIAYTFAIIINNYDSERGSIVSKMYKVLDELK